MNDETTITFTRTELFYLKDVINKSYWELKEQGEDEVVLKYILELESKIHKKYCELKNTKRHERTP